MLASQNKTTKDHVIELVVSGSATSSKEVFEQLPTKSRVALQTVHTAVRELITSGVLFKRKGKLYVSREWMVKVQTLFNRAPFINLNEGDSVKYSFPSLVEMDMYWKHLYYQLTFGNQESVWSYSTHNFWQYAPNGKETEKLIYEEAREVEKHPMFVVLGGSTFFDKKNIKELQSSSVRSEQMIIRDFQWKHTSVIGEYILRVQLNEIHEKEIDVIYKKYNDKNSSHSLFEKELSQYLKDVSKCKILLERNIEKAEKHKKLIEEAFDMRENR